MKLIGGKAFAHSIIFAMKLDMMTRIAGRRIYLTRDVFKAHLCLIFDRRSTLNTVGILDGLENVPIAFGNSLEFLTQGKVPERGTKRNSCRLPPAIKKRKRRPFPSGTKGNELEAVLGENFIEDPVDVVLEKIKGFLRRSRFQRHGARPLLSISE